MTLVKEAIDDDPINELINFMREEMEKLFQLMFSHRASNSYESYQAMPSSVSTGIPFGDTGYYPTWNARWVL